METETFASIIGFDLSTVVAFFNLAPFLISPNNASLPGGIEGGGPGGKLPKLGGGGGGGGGGGAAILYICIYLYYSESGSLANQAYCCLALTLQILEITNYQKNEREKNMLLLLFEIQYFLEQETKTKLTMRTTIQCKSLYYCNL